MDRARRAIQNLIPAGKESHLGEALQQVLSRYAGTPVAGVIFFTDGVTTGNGKKIADLTDFAKTKNVPLYFVGIGDDHEVRDLKLHDLQVEDIVYVNDRVIFEASLTGRGYKDMTLPIVLKVKDKDGNEIELAREKYTVIPTASRSRCVCGTSRPSPARNCTFSRPNCPNWPERQGAEPREPASAKIHLRAGIQAHQGAVY